MQAPKEHPASWFCPSPEPVSLLPSKVVLGGHSGRLKEVVKLPNEMNINPNADELLLKVKLIGVNYKKDIDPLRHHVFKNKYATVVPFNKIIGKILALLKHMSCTNFKFLSKYLVFPYSNCNIQHIEPCDHCRRLTNVELTRDTMDMFYLYPCLRNLEYGITIDGGLQDYIKIRLPSQSLLEIPTNVSLHDCCFMMEIMLPFYIFMTTLFIKYGYDQSGNKIMIILNDSKTETNDVLIVLQQLNIDRKSVVIMDPSTIKQLSTKEKSSLHKKFEFVLCFNFSSTSLDFTDYCIASVGLPSSKSRFHVVWFDQYAPLEASKLRKRSEMLTDKTFHHIRVGHKDFVHAQDLLSMLSSFNILRQSTTTSNLEDSSDTRPSVSSLETSLTTFSNQSLHLGSSSTTSFSLQKYNEVVKNGKFLRFRDEDSIINSEREIRSSHVSWLWYDKDIDFCRDCEFEDFGTSTHNIKDVNSLMMDSDAQPKRICYFNKPSKTANLNAFVLSS